MGPVTYDEGLAQRIREQLGERPDPRLARTAPRRRWSPSGRGPLRLVHSGLPSEEEACAAHAEGWQHYVDRLASRAEGTDPGPDAWMQQPAG